MILNSNNFDDPPQEQLRLLANLYDQGQFQQAMKRCEDLYQKYQSSPMLLNIRGAVFKGMGRLDLSVESYNKALCIKPDYAEIYINMGVTLQDQGRLEESIKILSNFLTIKPDYAAAYYSISNALKKVRFSRFNSSYEKSIISILDRKTIVKPASIAGAVVSLLKCHSTLNDIFSSYFVENIDECFDEAILILSESPLLLTFMAVCPLPDRDLEKVLSCIRSHILLNISKIPSSPSLLKVQSALALQCFTNEYIYDLIEDDIKVLKDIEKSVSIMLSNNEQPPPEIILCLASFKALHEYDWSENLQNNIDIAEVFKRQILDLEKEEKIKSQISVLGNIISKISVKVKKQYEENPYPRWINLGLRHKPASISKIVKDLKLKFSNSDVISTGDPAILIAGCGTGQHSIVAASTIKDSRVLAIDLSLSSLSYAKRKTEEFGIQNIDYMQADILNIRKLDRKFDLIESSGVLHHMDDPMAGWQALADCLRPGGFMRIGLYSESARSPVVKFREEIARSGLTPTTSNIRIIRAKIAASEDELSQQLRSWSDFYSMSELRDLIFHVQEHRFTLPQVKDCLDQLGLDFCGFEARHIVDKFSATYPSKDAAYDLEKWAAFEVANPTIFSGMYQFWCQKIV